MTVALVACGDDKRNWRPGAVLRSGVCVADNTADTLTGVDTVQDEAWLAPFTPPGSQ